MSAMTVPRMAIQSASVNFAFSLPRAAQKSKERLQQNGVDDDVNNQVYQGNVSRFNAI